MAEYIERENIYPLAKKIVDEIASGNYHTGVFGLDILDWIDDLPTADVRPVVRGKWLRNERGNYNCSNCNSEHNAVFGFFFCPNCGADMREES